MTKDKLDNLVGNLFHDRDALVHALEGLEESVRWIPPTRWPILNGYLVDAHSAVDDAWHKLSDAAKLFQEVRSLWGVEHGDD